MATDYPCPGCGAELKWAPGQDSLKCPYCGATARNGPTTEATGVIQEHRLDQAATQAARGFGTETRAVCCNACGASHELAPEITATECPFCGSTQIDDLEAEDQLRPESVLPFEIEKNDAVRQFRGWLGGLWFRPSALKTAAQLEQIHGVYVPAWTFDAQASSDWRAESGTYYEVEETYTSTVDGEEVTRTRSVRKTRWEPADGRHQGSYDDWLVQASGGLDQPALKGLLPFDLAKLRPYDTQFLSGFKAERYQVDLESAWTIAQGELHSQEKSACRALVPGDTQRNLEVDTTFADVTFKHTLLPIWIAAYRYNGEVYRYLVNGQSGEAHGDAPISWVKVALFIAAILLAIAICTGSVSVVGAVGAVVGR